MFLEWIYDFSLNGGGIYVRVSKQIFFSIILLFSFASSLFYESCIYKLIFKHKQLLWNKALHKKAVVENSLLKW